MTTTDQERAIGQLSTSHPDRIIRVSPRPSMGSVHADVLPEGADDDALPEFRYRIFVDGGSYRVTA